MYVLPANKDKYYNKLKPSGEANIPGSLADIKALPADQVTFDMDTGGVSLGL